MSQTWSPSDYQQHAGFVSALGASILARLAPHSGERILDLLRPTLCDATGQWTADYVRLQVVARRRS